jgi:16S rRNA (uracil1498-N3)-methyltransferase
VTAHHFFVSDAGGIGPGARVELSVEDSRHALRSLRMQPGEDVSLADGSGWFARGKLAGGHGDVATIEILEVEVRPQPRPAVTVAMAPPKGDRLAWAAQKLAEVGVDELLLLTDTERAVRKPGRGGADRENALGLRLERIAREAAMQSRRPFVMSIGRTRMNDAAGDAGERGSVLLLWEGATTPILTALDVDRMAGAEGIVLLVGPEGGFSEVELEEAIARAAAPVSLGPGILRTETAALTAAVLVLGRFGRLG